MPLVAVLDANVLYPAPLRDLLLHLAKESLFQPKWSDQIQSEWRRNLISNRPDINPLSLFQTQKWMDIAFPDASKSINIGLLKSDILPDPNDVHVLQLAISTKSQYIITSNLKDFPKHVVGKYGVEAIPPDEFILELINTNQVFVINAFKRQVSMLVNPPKTAIEVLSALERCGLTSTSKRLRELVE